MNSFFKKIQDAKRSGNLWSKFVCYVLTKFNYSNANLLRFQIRYHTYKKLEKKYKKYLDGISYKQSKAKKDPVKKIWICWFQGEENAPRIVKKCIDSIRFYCKEYEIIVITNENINEYVSFPDYVITKWRKGIITNTHLSDILRIELLIRYGGIWIDATTLLTGRIPDYVFSSNLFMFKFKDREDLAISYNSWFIYAQPDNRILKATRDLLYIYWEKETKLKEYFLVHLFVTLVSTKYKEDLKDMFEICDENAHMLQYNFKNIYNRNNYKEILRLSTIHKLTYKTASDDDNSYYYYILNNGDNYEKE